MEYAPVYAIGGITALLCLILLFQKGLPGRIKFLTLVCAALTACVLVLFLRREGADLPIPRRFRAPEPTPVEDLPQAASVRLTFPEGCTVADVIALLSENGVAERDALWDAARNGTFSAAPFPEDLPEGTERLEGYLFPDTYDFYLPEDPSSALNRLLSNFRRRTEPYADGIASAAERGYDLHALVTIASLIEKETDGTDQKNIASVIYNRLEGPGSRHGTYGLLQIDAAVLYGLPDHTGPLTRGDLEADTPYNLYKYPGLPPGPIASPGLTAFQAALDPAETDYYYYALAKDGRHRFFSDYSEFTAFLRSGDYVGNG